MVLQTVLTLASGSTHKHCDRNGLLAFNFRARQPFGGSLAITVSESRIASSDRKGSRDPGAFWEGVPAHAF